MVCGADGRGGDIYYEACKEIACGSELLVWYGDSYVQYVGIPVGLVDCTAATQTSANCGNDVDDRRRTDACNVASETDCEFVDDARIICNQLL